MDLKESGNLSDEQKFLNEYEKLFHLPSTLRRTLNIYQALRVFLTVAN